MAPTPRDTDHSPERVARVFDKRDDPANPLTVRDIQIELDWPRRTVYDKLETLAERGDIATRKPSTNLRVWWVPMDGIDEDCAPDPIARRMAHPPVTTPAEVLDWAADEVPGRTDEKRERRAANVLAAYEYLREEITAAPAEIARHATTSDSPVNEDDSRWTIYVRDALSALPGVLRAPHVSLIGYAGPDSPLAELFDHTIEPWIDDDVVPPVKGSPEITHHRRALVQQAVNHVRKTGSARKSDFEAVLPDYYGLYEDFEGLWLYILKDALVKAPGVVATGPNNRDYVYATQQENA